MAANKTTKDVNTDSKEVFIKKVFDEPKPAQGGLPPKAGLEIWQRKYNEHLRHNQDKDTSAIEGTDDNPNKGIYNFTETQVHQQFKHLDDDVSRGTLSPNSRALVNSIYSDTKDLSDSDVVGILDTIQSNILTPQVSKTGNTYLNPDGLVTVADVINMLTDKNDTTPSKTSVDHVSNSSDYFNQGYNQLLKDCTVLKGRFTRRDLITPVQYNVMYKLIMVRSTYQPSLAKQNIYTYKDLEEHLRSVEILEDNDTKRDDLVSRKVFSRVYSFLTKSNKVKGVDKDA